MKRIILYIAVTGALLSFAFGQAQQESTDSKSEQEVEQMIEKYRTAFLHHDIPTLEKIWADDYVFVNAFGEVLTKAHKGQYSGQPVSGQYRSTLVWVKGPNGWQLVANQLTPLAAK
jgi:ketosteroid isomerase-like protein